MPWCGYIDYNNIKHNICIDREIRCVIIKLGIDLHMGVDTYM